jgi:hypothetical protein
MVIQMELLRRASMDLPLLDQEAQLSENVRGHCPLPQGCREGHTGREIQQ